MKVDYIPGASSRTATEATACLDRCRVSVLGAGLIRAEYSWTGAFLDDPTQSVWYREAKPCGFSFRVSEGRISVIFPDKTVVIDAVRWQDSYVRWGGKREKISNRANLGGTTRTLDMSPDEKIHFDDPLTGERTDIPCEDKRLLGEGVAARNGIAFFDDAASLVIHRDGTLAGNPLVHDYYLFLHKNDYFGAVSDLYDLTGRVPMLPRFVFGNWWSRYWAYSEEGYLNLLDKFREKQIPLSVATLDMDWHYVDIQKEFRIEEQHLDDESRYGEWHGWTGFTWNRHLFPDYRRFLGELHRRLLKVTLNLHPASGIRWFEDSYPAVCAALGRDAGSRECVWFDFTDNRFIRAYFDMLHAYERDGVDFWWIDWQQGNTSKIPGYDPLWGLNHYHYCESVRGNSRGLILSRYSGIGSHRYPLGFSGDTTQTWRILRYVIAFTARAANIGYTFWSHDIGGHHAGEKDDELYIRWLQFALFNPINRLHSASGALYGKEPWNYRRATELLAEDLLRRRQRFVPYLYSVACRNRFENDPFIKPVYYLYPQDERAYRCPHEYFLGDLLVCPVTVKTEARTGLAHTRAFLPEGTWTDIYTDARYTGGCETDLYRELGEIPVFVRDGTILYRDHDVRDATDNPMALDFRLFVGDGQTMIYEDDGVSQAYAGGHCYRTFVTQKREDGVLTVWIRGEGDDSVVPEKRAYSFEIPNIRAIALTDGDGRNIPFRNDDGTVRFTLSERSPKEELRLTLPFEPLDRRTYLLRRLWSVLIASNGGNQMRQDLYDRFVGSEPDNYGDLVQSSSLPLRVKQRLAEVLATQPLPRT